MSVAVRSAPARTAQHAFCLGEKVGTNPRSSSPSILRCRTHRLVTKAMAAVVPPITVVGKGRVGQALQLMGAGEDVLVGRGEPVDGPQGPIVVCTRNNDLQGAVSRFWMSLSRQHFLLIFAHDLLRRYMLYSLEASNRRQTLILQALWMPPSQSGERTSCSSRTACCSEWLDWRYHPGPFL